MLKKNDLLELNISSMTNLGFGVARHDGIVVFVSGAVTGEVIEARIIKITPSYAVGRVEKIIKESPVRSSERCSSNTCHTCAYKCISYDEELRIKKEDVEQAFIKSGLSEVKVESIVPSPELLGYRNKAQYPIAKDKNGNYVIGFYAPKSHRVTEARDCPLAPSAFAELLELLATFFKKHNLSVYDERTGKGLLRHIYLRRGEISGEILLTLVINGKSLSHKEELVTLIRNTFPDVVGILLNVNQENTNVVLGEEFITLWGRDYIYDTLAGVSLKITAPSFYQVNRSAAELLYKKARELAKPEKDDLLLDLYCGAGSIGLSMADAVGELIGIEIVESAVECARENASRAGFDNAKFYTGDAAFTEKLLDNAKAALGRDIKPSIVVLDPPRGGCAEELLDFVAALAPKRVVYISCNPTTLARDAAIFKSLGYLCSEVTAFDLFPTTGHVESVTCFTKGDN